MTAAEPSTPHPQRALGFPAVAWVIYDFGYSLFVFVVFARYLSDWLISDLGHPDWVYTTTQVAAAAVLLMLMPLAGVAADVLGRHGPLLALFTCIAGGAAGLVGIVDTDVGVLGVLPLLLLAGTCAVATGLAFAQFDPMLAGVATPRHWGIMSGVGVAFGYLGIIVWLTLLAERVVGEGDKQVAFLPAALVLLACSIPLLVVAREERRPASVEGADSLRATARLARSQLSGAIGRLRERRDIMRLLIGRFLYADAIGTVNIFAIVYISRLGGFTEADKNRVVLLVVTCAGIGALVAGWVARRVGPRLVLMYVIPAFSFGLAAVAIAGAHWTVWLLAPVLGMSLGTAYTVDRVFMLALTPEHMRGELFGFFNLVGRVAQALGPFILWGGVIFLLHDLTGWLEALDASRVSFVLIAITALVGLRIVQPLDDGYRSPTR